MNILTGLLAVFFAGVLQGSFFLPMTYAKKWDWAHKWFAFSLLGMVVVNWIIALLGIHNLLGIIAQIPHSLLWMVLIMGLGWGIGAILFGMAMDLLGMALGYPVIMGINAAAGTIIPALIFSPHIFLQEKGIFILAGAVLTIVGIIVCSRASTMKELEPAKIRNLTKGLILAVISGFTSCLPNLGAAFSGKITAIALNAGVGDVLAGNVVWSLFFTAGAMVNIGYCLFLMSKRKTTAKLGTESPTVNWTLMLAMSLMWIGSFYFYGIGCSMLGSFGLIIGWPLLITLSIVIGNLWGLYRGEWKDATLLSRRTLNRGLVILIISILLTAMSNNF